MQMFSHPGIRDIRKNCDKGAYCLDKVTVSFNIDTNSKSSKHQMLFSHPAKSRTPVCEIRMLNSAIRFYENKDRMLAELNHKVGMLHFT